MRQLALPAALIMVLAGSACSKGPVSIPNATVLPAMRALRLSAPHGHCVIVKCDDDGAAWRCADACGGRWLHKFPGTCLHLIDIGDLDLEKALSRCKQVQGVAYAEDDAEVITAGGPVHPALKALIPNALDRLHVASAWQVSRGAGVKVAVLDTGVDLDQPTLVDKVSLSANFTINSFLSLDDVHGHGTFMAGAIAGPSGGPGGGVAPDATLMIGKVLEDDGKGVTSAVTDGIVWAANQGADVILLGLVARKPTQALQDAVDFAWSKGCVVVAAAGNDHSAAKNEPASYPHCIAVAATDATGDTAKFSSFGAHWVDVSAPGEGVLGLFPTTSDALGVTGAGAMDGTSVAAAFVAGEAALLRAAMGPAATNADIRSRIEATCSQQNLMARLKVRSGRIDIGKALAF